MAEAQHISHRYDNELKAVQNRVLAMGELIERQIDTALAALAAGNHALAEQVEQMDHEVNAHEVAIDEQCTRILARHQPAARDLRLIIAIIKTITDLERIGDHAKNMAEYVVFLVYGKDVRHLGLKGMEREIHAAESATAQNAKDKG